MPTPQIQNPTGAFGADVTDSSQSAVVLERVAAVAISRGNLVALSTDASRVIKCLTNTAVGLLIGVALADVAAGAVLPVCIYGPVHGVLKATTAVTAGNVVTRDVTTAAGVSQLTGAVAVTTIADLRGFIGTVMADATAAATSASIFIGRI